MISIIAAVARHNVIGKANELPWYLPADLRHFRSITTGHTVVMGRKTFDSVIARIGRPLPERTNVVLTRDTSFRHEGVVVIHSIDEVKQLAKRQEVFIMGGSEVYQQALPFAKKIYLTEIDAEFDGDTFFPELKKTQWQEVHREPHQKDQKNPYNYSFVTLERPEG